MQHVTFDEIWNRRVHLNEIRPGMVLYPVFSVCGEEASVLSPVYAKSLPYNEGTLPGYWRFDAENYFADCAFADDNNIQYDGRKTTQYNFHTFFVNRSDAIICAELICAGDLGSFRELAQTIYSKRCMDMF